MPRKAHISSVRASFAVPQKILNFASARERWGLLAGASCFFSGFSVAGAIVAMAYFSPYELVCYIGGHIPLATAATSFRAVLITQKSLSRPSLLYPTQINRSRAMSRDHGDVGDS